MKLPSAGSLFGEGPMIGCLVLLGAAFDIHDQRVRYESQNSAARNKIQYIFAVSVRR